MDINICLSSDNNYSRYAGIVITSVLSNANEDDFIKFYILDGGIDNNNKKKIFSLKNIKQCEINFIQIDENLFDVYKNIGTHYYISLSTYYRLKLASLLPFDVAMPRQDYERFIDIFNNSNCGDLYAKLSDEQIDSMSFITKIKHKKTNHVFLDIFVVDFCGENYSKETQFRLSKKIVSKRNKLKKEITGLNTSKRLEKIKEFRQKYTDNSKTKSDILMGVEFGHLEKIGL